MIDDWLNDLDITIARVENPPANGYWKLTKARWYNVHESRGKHAIYVDMRADGQRMMGGTLLVQNGGQHFVRIEKPESDANGPQGESYGGNYPMHGGLGSYTIRPYDPNASADTVIGLGMGDGINAGLHTSFGLVWTWTVPDDGETQDTEQERRLLEHLSQVIAEFETAAFPDGQEMDVIYAEAVADLKKVWSYVYAFAGGDGA